MLNTKNICKNEGNSSLPKGDERVKVIINWLKKIKESELSVRKYFKTYDVPFNIRRYFEYQRILKELGEKGLLDKRGKGGQKKLTPEGENFIKICVASNPEVSPKWLKEELEKRYGIKVTPSGITRMLKRLTPEAEKRTRGRPRIHNKVEQNSCGDWK